MKVRKIDMSNNGVGYSFNCPGCDHPHLFVTKGDGIAWTFNGEPNNPSFWPSLLNRWEIDGKELVCHLYVTKGLIEYMQDCTHNLKGKLIEMEDL